MLNKELAENLPEMADFLAPKIDGFTQLQFIFKNNRQIERLFLSKNYSYFRIRIVPSFHKTGMQLLLPANLENVKIIFIFT